MGIFINKKLNTNNGVYIELECDSETKSKLSEYIKKYINPNLNYSEFHTTLIYSKKPFKGMIKYEIGKDLKRVYAGVEKIVRFDNPAENIYAIALQLKCKVCEIAHQELMKLYDFKYDYSEYIPHVTLTYKGKDVDVSKLPVPKFLLKFDKINVEPLNEDWANNVE